MKIYEIKNFNLKKFKYNLGFIKFIGIKNPIKAIYYAIILTLCGDIFPKNKKVQIVE